MSLPTNSARRGLLAGGNWIVDHVKMIDVWPSQDALATITTQTNGNGGGPYNVTKNLAKLGCGFPLAGVGLIGRDADGETILHDCGAHGIDSSAIQLTSAAPTSYTDVMTVSGTGRRTFFHQHGANALLDVSHFDLSKSSARIFYLGYLCLLQTLDSLDESEVGTPRCGVSGGKAAETDTQRKSPAPALRSRTAQRAVPTADGNTKASKLFKQAHSLDMKTVADLVSCEAGDFSAIVNPSLPHLNYLFLNEYELARLVGASASKNPAQLESQAQEVLRRGVSGAVIVHLPEGALCAAKDQPAILQPSVRMPANQIVGTAGAGDAFSAGFLLGLHEGWDFQRCLELGVCAAAASLRDATCSAAVESWQNCLALGHKMGFHASL